MRKKILVTGANGQLGQSIAKFVSTYKDLEFTFVTQEKLEFDPLENIDAFFQDKVFDVVVNCAAYTAVDKAETEYELANLVNHLAVKRIAEICKAKDMSLIHISTDYVFNGKNYRPYVETDLTEPLNVYGVTKLKGEQAIQEINPNGVIIRTGWVYSEFGNNFVKTMLRLGKERDCLSIIFDQVGTPTYASDLAKAVMVIVIAESSMLNESNQATCIYHYSNEGVTSWYDFAQTIFDLANINCQVDAIETKDYPVPAKRPYYSLLNKDKIKQTYGVKIPYWEKSLSVFVKEFLAP